MENNIFIIDSVTKKIVEKHNSKSPKDSANSLACGYFERGEGKPIHKHIPTKKYPNRYGITTPTDFFIHYFVTDLN